MSELSQWLCHDDSTIKIVLVIIIIIIILVFGVLNVMEIFRRELPDVECKGVWKNRDFRPISRYISETIQYTAIVTIECE